jgi:ribosomal protein L37E
MTSSSNRSRSKSESQREREREKASAVQVKCKFCGNTFMAQPKKAVCAKCGRPANKSLAKTWLVASLLVPVVGFVNSLVIRPHSPVAASQGLWGALIGSAVYTGIYLVLHNVLKLF